MPTTDSSSTFVTPNQKTVRSRLDFTLGAGHPFLNELVASLCSRERTAQSLVEEILKLLKEYSEWYPDVELDCCTLEYLRAFTQDVPGMYEEVETTLKRLQKQD